MKRRTLLLGVAAAALAGPGFSEGAQPKKRFRVGFLAVSDESTAKPAVDAFVAGMVERKYRVDQNLVLDVLHARGDISRLPALARELVALKPDVLVGLSPAVIAIKNETSTIPIVMLSSSDPVASGLVKSLGRPGTNVTGIANHFEPMVEKHIELLVEIAPKISRVGLLNYSVPTQGVARFESAARKAAAMKGLTLVVAVAEDEKGLREAFKRFESERVGALVVVPTAPALQMRETILGSARGLRLLTVSALPPAWSESGGLLNYGSNTMANYRYAASFVDRILRGGNPAEMPVEQLGNFELVINLKAAMQLGIEIPRSVLGRADRVIE